MVTLTSTRRARLRAEGFLGMPAFCWAAFAVSRLLVLAAGAAGVLFMHRVHGWEPFDPQHLTLRLGSAGNVLAAPVYRWDALRYVSVSQHGYTSAGSTLAFPMYPLLIRAVSTVVISPVVAGVLVSLTAFAVGLVLVHRIASEEIGPRGADTTVLLLMFAPLSFTFSAVYTESLMLALSAGALYLARQNRLVLACVIASAATLTHIWGVFLVAPLGLMYWKQRGRPRELRRLWAPGMLALALPVIALLGFCAYLHARGWGWLAPLHNQDQLYAGRKLVGPPVMLFRTVEQAALGLAHLSRNTAGAGVLAPGIQNLNYLCLFVISVLALVSAWRRMPKEYALLAGLVLLVATSSAINGTEPLRGFGRYLLPIFPLWIGASAWIERRRLTLPVVMLSSVMLIVYTDLFARWVAVF